MEAAVVVGQVVQGNAGPPPDFLVVDVEDLDFLGITDDVQVVFGVAQVVGQSVERGQNASLHFGGGFVRKSHGQNVLVFFLIDDEQLDVFNG